MKAEWVFGKGINFENNERYFKLLGETFYNEIILRVQRQNLDHNMSYSVKEETVDEIKFHSVLSRELNKISYTNDNIMKIVTFEFLKFFKLMKPFFLKAFDYLNKKNNTKALIIYGACGSGKSTIISKIANEVSSLNSFLNSDN